MPSASSNIASYLRLVVAAWREETRDDAELLDRFAQARDEAAFATLLCRHGPLVWQTCQRILGDTPDAEDAFQTTFLALARKAGRFPVKSLAGWLHRVARRTSLHAQAGVRRRRDLERHLQVVKEPKTEENTKGTELYAALDEELAGLPERLRVPLLLHYIEGRSQVEVARFLGCARSVLQKRLTQGEAILRQRLEGRGLAMSIGSMAALLGGAAGAPGMPAGLISSTARAAVAFRSGAFTGRAAEAARAVLGSFPASSLGTTIMRKSLWIVLACVCSLGVGLAAWQVSSAHSEAVESPETAAPPEAAVEPGSSPVDRYGDPLPQGALARLGTLRLRHVGIPFPSDGVVGSVVFSRNGKVLLTACPANPIRLWDVATGKLLRSFGARVPNPAVSIVLSPDGRILAAGNDGHENCSVSLWEVATGKLLQRHLGASIRALAFSLDGKMLLTVGRKENRSEDNHILVWEVATGKEARDQPLLNVEKADRPLHSIFSPDGKTLASIHDTRDNDKVVHLWEAASGKKLNHLSLGKVTISRGAVAFSPDSRFLAVSSYTERADNRSDGAVHLWEVATGKEVRKWTPDKAGLCSLAFSPDGKLLATGSAFGPIRLWEAATGKELCRCQDYRAHVVALAFSPDSSTLASLAWLHDHTARLWEVASGKERTRASGGHVGSVLSVSFSPDGKSLISGGRDGLVGLWNPETGQEQRSLLRVGDFQALAALSPDGKTILSVGNSFSPNYQNLIEAACQSPTQICVWDRATAQKLRQFPGPVGAVQSLALTPDGKILVLRFVHSVHLLEIATGKEIRWFNAAQCCVALSSDGKTLAVARCEQESKGTVHFYETATGKDLGDIKAQRVVGCLAFSPDGQILAVGGEEDSQIEGGITVRLWRVRADKKWKEAGRLVGHQNALWEVTFSPDGKTLASASGDGTLRLWEVATGQERCRFAGHSGDVWCLAFAPDGRRLAAGGNDTAILVWDVTGRLQNGQLPPVKLSAQEVKSLWADLAGADASRAGRAIWTLAAAPAQALPLLRKHLRPIAPPGQGIVRLIADLDSDTFAVRQRATDELKKLRDVAELALRQALAKSTSLEMRRRLEQLLEPLERDFPLSGEQVRSCRAFEVLGQIGTPEALRLLKTLAQGEPEARQTREAQAVLICLRTRVNATKP